MQYVLTTWDRVTLMRAANGLQGIPTYQLRRIRSFIDKMNLNEEEEAAVGFIRMGTSFSWADTLRTFIIDFDSHDLEILILLKDALIGWPWMGQEAEPALVLMMKIGIDIEEVEAKAEAMKEVKDV